jgi:hypothetical protein
LPALARLREKLGALARLRKRLGALQRKVVRFVSDKLHIVMLGSRSLGCFIGNLSMKELLTSICYVLKVAHGNCYGTGVSHYWFCSPGSDSQLWYM